MWSKRFLFFGLASGAILAALSLAGIWLTLEAATGVFANYTAFAAGGIAMYPLCWWRLVFSARDYSKGQTGSLVALTYGASCAVACVLMLVSMANEWTVLSATGPKFNPLMVAAPLLAISLTTIGASIMAIPYAIVATPVAFAHRAMMPWLFGKRASETART